MLYNFNSIKKWIDEWMIHILPNVNELMGKVILFDKRTEQDHIAIRGAAQIFIACSSWGYRRNFCDIKILLNNYAF
jgi:hypothetical protein